jgi:branched-chain amino acid transport system substrate-binding protein
VGDYLRSKAFEKGLTILAFEPSGFSHFFTSQPIVDFQQIQNSTVGIPLGYYDPSIWQNLNINTLILEPEQMLSALEDGAIQAYSTTMEQTAGSPIKQPLKFIPKTNLILTGQFIVINQKILSTLPKSLQTVLIKSVENSVTKKKSTESKHEVMVALEKKGFKRYDFPEKVQSKLKQLAQQQIELNRELWGNYLIEMTFQLLHKDQPINDNQILIGLDADLTSSSSQSGVAIKRGIELALDEINQAGGVLGKELVLKSLSHTGFSDQGIRNIKKFAKEKNLVAIVGGLHSPVALAEQEIIHQEKIVYLDPWAAATAIVENGYSPNYTFRLSVRDQYAASFLVAKALERGYKKIAYLYEDTGWGRGNLNGIISALKQQTNDDITLVATPSFVWGEDDFNHQLGIIEAKGAEVILLVANAPEGVNIFKNMALRKSTIPVISHWGITGGNLDDSAREALKKLDIKVLQTFSLMDSNTEKVTAFKKRYFERYPTAGAQKILSESGTVHAYELIYLLVKAIEQAQSIDRVKVRNSLERIENYSGLIKTYHRPFTALNHDALGLDDLNLRIFRNE